MSFSQVRIPIKNRGSLIQFGYHLNEPDYIREKALIKALEFYSYKEIISKLVALEVFNKNQNPYYSNIVKSDITWLKNNK